MNIAKRVQPFLWILKMHIQALFDMSHAVTKSMMKILVFPSVWQWKLSLWAWSFNSLNTTTGLGKGHLGAIGYGHFWEIRISVVFTDEITAKFWEIRISVILMSRNHRQSPPPPQYRIQIPCNAYLSVIVLVRMVITIESINLCWRKWPRKGPEFTSLLVQRGGSSHVCLLWHRSRSLEYTSTLQTCTVMSLTEIQTLGGLLSH